MAHALLARLWQLYRPVVHDAAAMHECNAVAQIDGLVDVVGDKQHRRAMPMAGAQQVVLQLGRVMASSAAKGSSSSSSGGSRIRARARATRLAVRPRAGRVKP
jgi:hypothetical protein